MRCFQYVYALLVSLPVQVCWQVVRVLLLQILTKLKANQTLWGLVKALKCKEHINTQFQQVNFLVNYFRILIGPIQIIMGWRAFFSPPVSSGGLQQQNRSDGRQQDPLRISERRCRRRRNAMTIFMMEDLLQTDTFQSLLNIHSARRGSRTSGE